MTKTTESNGSRNIWELVRLLTVIILAGLAAVAGYGQLRERIKTNCDEDAKVHPQVGQNTLSIVQSQERVAQVQRDMSKIDIKIDDLSARQNQQLQLQQEILREIQSQ